MEPVVTPGVVEEVTALVVIFWHASIPAKVALLALSWTAGAALSHVPSDLAIFGIPIGRLAQALGGNLAVALRRVGVDSGAPTSTHPPPTA